MPGPDGGPRLSNVWVYNGKAYDLSDWISKHPGGEFFIGRTKNRDITSIIGSYHRDPEKIERMLERYSLGRDAVVEDVHPKNNAPDFLFTEGFDSWRDTPHYDFTDRNDLLHQIKGRLKEPALAARLKRMDRLFDVVAALLLVAYFAVEGLRLFERSWMPLWAFVILMVVLRSSLAGFGHYAIHRAQKGANKYFVNAFDFNYVALSFVTADGHALLHHPHTQSEVDIKKNVFTFMMDLPRGFRVPVHTLHKFGHTVTGMFVRMLEICKLTRKVGMADMYGSWRGGLPHFIGAFGTRFLLLGEMVLFLVMGDFWAWALQFVVTLWVSTFLVVASHDFEVETEEIEVNTDDWAVNQLEQAYDLKVVGNRYVDCFLSAGLSSHRAHHVLPFQRSGFANIASEDVIREEAAKFGVEWLPAKSFFADRLPKQVATYLLAPSRPAQEQGLGFWREHFSPSALRTCADYTVKGFTGIGTV
ncbi:cytochrome b5 domain-containing protein [Tsukamurella sp. 8F]|uniref:cytochrome b5 domain-containing protein n=1 Tax=unclassified Tsukamurella TaxID=2633480 RepID=UPI0023B943D5|nr:MULTISPECIES: cytochrome b5 domain-containing protein [unclassified Tsukamurella]MDF0529088.1 cytochrome b5 domain-containing protein [Tsukamurella sp. 8J]MDF0589011.1 cytochrome b5 domain-containing protein [Tsukamurella sp. 8F]